MVEFCIGLVGLLAVIGGIMILGDMSLARTAARVRATRDASRLSMQSANNSVEPIRAHIRSVTEGGDNQRYSQDDSYLSGGAVETFLTLIEPNQPQILSGYAPSNILANIRGSEELMASTGLVMGQDYEQVDIRDIPIIRKLFVNQESVDIGVSVWSVRTGDLY